MFCALDAKERHKNSYYSIGRFTGAAGTEPCNSDSLFDCPGETWFTAPSRRDQFCARRCFSLDSAEKEPHCEGDATLADLSTLLTTPGILVLPRTEFPNVATRELQMNTRVSSCVLFSSVQLSSVSFPTHRFTRERCSSANWTPLAAERTRARAAMSLADAL